MGSSKSPRYWAVIPAAGGGTRMRAERPKQYLQVRSRALIEYSLAPFFHAGWIDGVVVVLAPGDEDFIRLPVARHWKLHTTSGGVTRSESVLAGLKRVAELTQGFMGDRGVYALVHDAARPCLTRQDLERLKDEASDEQGGLLAVPVADTLKRGNDDHVIHTVDRRNLWRAQTPQMFRVDLLRLALESCRQRGIEITDEAAAMEAAGYKPLLVPGRESNFKVTYPEDLALAEFWLSRQELER
ncbi:MAG: 2-C-methyl-D-erythritol 4-phosphate cytidylyltransferase [Gammaproteobacteria bacterium]|nr:2-C-methyl-D-erythritol 4-phosphate cytidylyltransferase [Gammaproteobacteria bacterium]